MDESNKMMMMIIIVITIIIIIIIMIIIIRDIDQISGSRKYPCLSFAQCLETGDS